jgi:hypothetical protein
MIFLEFFSSKYHEERGGEWGEGYMKAQKISTDSSIIQNVQGPKRLAAPPAG